MFRIVLLGFFCVVLVWASTPVRAIMAAVACGMQLGYALMQHGSAMTGSLALAAAFGWVTFWCGREWRRERAGDPDRPT